ncbi:NADH-quinone oxidoreductase subunit NuoE [Xenorhabdus nematophila]|uniref:NADH-quinone oxidoreductase subunit E n=1 Tax=Xenorhabdus nematophila (strain ATCC 19061 / DSM 3370 / CCUG 14189 / LMG 1036 / NCIMB 9965 / AN6) TaxID=406817 RepID=D3VJ11_XENNA|nr:NADH-quinone oxidoreductase subunit NuoE [Xenorhabdus nematophila]CEE90293.1 NADH dehydrogenase I chain E [Xenorhabdus nematophila str. Anatoliense]CEF28436.1 NADH dehydrogenase I chain E [Xenorhabdus nematophila str. Websteri]AYA39873.1 NADH-quinone oxidoreductase subunit NuoE [Xenorhabdus nematophila]KHD29005.1 NADH dehydrogenase [Xenorhabdus nematophila]MBA0018440.1 NADH-quinone oxidoreductase subunit NuoE [Xenorhabdus nematophila]
MQSEFNANKQVRLDVVNVTDAQTPDEFVLSAEERDAIEQEKHHYEDPRAASIEALKIVQKQRGWVPDGAIYAIAEVLGIPASDVEGVATFYSQIYRQPVGRHIIRYCDSVVCHITGYQGVQAAIESHLNIRPGQTTADGRFTLLPTCCLGNCDKGPAMMIDEDTHCYVRPEEIEKLLEQYQ